MDAATFAAAQRIGIWLPRLDARLRISYPIFASRVWNAPANGWAIIRLLAPGGSGARLASGNNGTGGYSGAWGCKVVRVKKGDQIVFTIGAGGVATTVGNGNHGGISYISILGEPLALPQAPGGIFAASGVPVVPAGPALPAGWDFGAASVRPGAFAGATGGAGVDILMQGNDATTSASITNSGGGGTGGPSVSGFGGGALPSGASLLGEMPAASTQGLKFAVDVSDWGISFYGGSGGGNSQPGGNGGGGGPVGGNGGIGGGGGGNQTAAAGQGGLGGGGGAGTGGGAGGNGYGHVVFFADMQM